VKWATRARIHVDRAASAWLIRRFIDPAADFVFVSDPADVPSGATAFDMRGVDLSHHEGRCTFETLLTRYELTADPALEEIGRIVHEADLDDGLFDTPAAAGLDVVIRGLTLVGDDDQATLEVTDRMFDGLHEYLRQQLLRGRPPA
jgi:hypothetical protein